MRTHGHGHRGGAYHRPALIALVVLSAILAAAGIAFAAGLGLANPSFEDGLQGWHDRTVRDAGYGNRDLVYDTGDPRMCVEGNPYGVCSVGSDTFTVDDSGDESEITVEPLHGSKMARLGGPFPNKDVRQAPRHLAVLSQTFKVDPATPVLELNYNVFTWDYQGFDSLEFRVTLTDEHGAVIAQHVQGSFGPSDDTSLKTTGWVPNHVDLTGYADQDVHLSIESGGTKDSLYGIWAYVDAGMVGERPVGEPQAEPVVPPGGGEPVDIGEISDPASGLKWFTASPGSVALFGPGSHAGQDFDHCMDLTLNIPIDGGAGTVSDGVLILRPHSGGGNRLFDLTQTSPGNWKGTVHCVESGSLFVQYTLTENGDSQRFTIPLGGLTLIDPQGIVYNKAHYDAAIAGGATPEQARSASAIEGAVVRLQRKVSGEFVNVLSGDPGISPKVNPQTTGTDGKYQWDVSDGEYRVRVEKLGFFSAVSDAVTIPPPKTDLHVAMEPDNTGLSATISSGPNDATTNGAFTADTTPAFAFSGNGDLLDCRVDGDPFATCSSPITLDTLAEGSHTFEVRPRNSLGAVGSATARSFVVDATSPTAFSVSTPADSLKTADATPSFSWEAASDVVSGLDHYELIVDGSQLGGDVPAGTTALTPPTAIPDGSHGWHVRAVDKAGNGKDSASRSFTIDTTPPLVFALESPSENATALPPATSFSWDSTSDETTGVDHYELWIDGAKVSDVATSVCSNDHCSVAPPSALSDGAHTWEVHALDGLGNSRSSETRHFSVDAIAPTTAISSGPSGKTTDKTPTFVYTTDDPAATFRCTVDGAPVDCSGIGGGSYTPAPQSLGKHVFAARAVDQAQNEGAAVQRSFEVVSPPKPVDTDSDGVPDAKDTCPKLPAKTQNGCPPPKPPCSGLTGLARAQCVRALKCATLTGKKKKASCLKQSKALAKCDQLSGGKKRKSCVKRVKALAKCSKIKKKKKRAKCVKAAKKIGASSKVSVARVGSSR